MMEYAGTPRIEAFRRGIINEHVLSSLILECVELMRNASNTILIPNFGKARAESKMEFGMLEPVTAIDRSMSDFILGGLRQSLPGSYSEEDLPASTEERRRENLLWQVDPLDGTQEFIEGVFEGVSVQAALLCRIADHYRPIAGIVYRPARDELWYTDEYGKVRFERDGRPEPVPSLSRDIVLKAALRKVDPDLRQQEFYRSLAATLHEELYFVESGGAGSWFTELVEGKVDIIMANQDRSKSWDVAMGMALVEARGGFVCDYQGRPFIDLNGEQLVNREGFVASILYSKDEIISHIPRDLLNRSHQNI